MEKTLSLRKDYLNIIEEKNNILLHTNTYLFDYDFDILKKELLKIKKDAYLPNDKILDLFYQFFSNRLQILLV